MHNIECILHVHGTRVRYVRHDKIIIIVGFKSHHKKVKSNFTRTITLQRTVYTYLS